MKNIKLLLFFVVIAAHSDAQTLSPKATPASGGFYSAGGNSLAWTLGETYTTTLSSSNNKLTQGFQQPYIMVKIIDLKIFIEGYYAGNSQMQPLLNTSGLSPDPGACDSITVELHTYDSPYSLVQSANGLLLTNGNAEIRFPSSLKYGSYYLAVRHRNAMETWSKNPVSITPAMTTFDFTSP